MYQDCINVKIDICVAWLNSVPRQESKLLQRAKKMTEEKLISRVQSGDEIAFKELVEVHQSRVFHTALGLLHNYQDAEDITQEVFVKVYESISRFKGKSKFSTWIYRITINISLNFLRARKRKKRFAFLLSFDDGNDKSAKQPADTLHPGIAFENQERDTILFKAIDRLPENQKTAFMLHNTEDLSYEEISEVMRNTISSVESLIHRAKKNLREYLSDYYQMKKQAQDST